MSADPRDPLALLHALTREIVLERDPKQVLARILDAAIEYVEAEHGFIILSGEGAPVICAARTRGGEPAASVQEEMSRTILQHVLSTGKPFLEPDVAANFDVSTQASVKRLSLRAVFAYPVEFRGKHLGVIYLDWRKRWPNRRVEEIREMLAAFARNAAIVLEHARLCAEAMHDRLEKRIDLMLDTFGGATGADVCHLVLLDAEPRRVVTRDSQGRDTAPIDAGSPLVVDAVRKGAAVRTPTQLCVPLLHDGRIVAAAVLEIKSADRIFSEEDEALVSAFARKTAPQLHQALVESRKDAELSRMKVIVEEALRTERLRCGASNLVSASRAMQEVLRTLDRMVESPYPLLLVGESGTGKELLARAVHFNGPRRELPFFAVNCGALSETLLDSELFGHVRGAFTGADRDRVGVFEAAGEGTLFLDEVGEMSAGMQVKMLRAIEQREVRPVGGRDVIPVRARVIAATNRDLEEMVSEGLFREDLYYRLAVLRVKVPPLRERPEDVGPIFEHIVRQQGARLTLTPEALACLQRCGWKGNVRELESEAKRLMTLGIETAREEDLSPSLRQAPSTPSAAGSGPSQGQSLQQYLDDCERSALLAALKAAGNSRQDAAKLLGINRVTLYRKLERLGLEAPKEDTSA